MAERSFKKEVEKLRTAAGEEDATDLRQHVFKQRDATQRRAGVDALPGSPPQE